MVKKQFLISLSVCLLMAIAIVLFSNYRQFYYLLFLGAVSVGIVIFKKGKITIYDWFALVIFTIPFHSLRIGGETHFIRLSEIAFIPFFLWWIAQKSLKENKQLKIRKEFIAILGFLLINILSTSKSMYPLMSIKRVLIISYLILFCYIISDMIRNKERFSFVIKVMIIVASASSILAILQVFVPALHLFKKHYLVSLGGITLYRASAGWHDPNYYALYLTMNIALILSYLFSNKSGGRRMLKICFLLQCGGLLATFSRMGHICFFVVFLYLLCAYGKGKAAFIILLIIVIAAVGMVLFVDYIYDKHPVLKAYLFRFPDLNMLRKYPHLILVHRWDAFRANWKMFLDNPFLGVGPYMSVYNYDKYKMPDALTYSRQYLATHNQYLQLLSEKGIFGFISFMAFILLIWRKLTFYIKRNKHTKEGAILIGFKAGLISYLVASLVGNTTHELQFWLTAGLCLALFSMFESSIPNEQ